MSARSNLRRWPSLRQLYRRHLGLSRSSCAAFAEAAGVCLSRHHSPPTTFEIHSREIKIVGALIWPLPDDRARRACNNADDATRDGAYSVGIAAIEMATGLNTIDRAETRTVADYYLARADDPSLERAYRLEIAGSDQGTTSMLKSRLRRKIEQAAEGESDLPAIALVVGFKERAVLFAAVGDDAER